MHDLYAHILSNICKKMSIVPIIVVKMQVADCKRTRANSNDVAYLSLKRHPMYL